MKKILLTFMFALMTCIGINAQTAIETSKITDNMYLGVGGGVTTPLDFNSVFPLNTGVKVVVGKNVTPVLGFEVEALALLNDNHFADLRTAINSTNIGLNSTFNLFNLFSGYQGKPRIFEMSTNIGLGWLHNYGTPNGDCANFLTAKTALDLTLFIGKPRAISLTVSPGIYWSLSGTNGAIQDIKFNKHNAQAAVMATLTWHFKNKNGLRYFKSYDVGAMVNEIGRLNDELAKKPQEVVVEKVVEIAPAPTTIVEQVNPVVVFFSKGSSLLTEADQAALKTLSPELIYNVYGYASPEGSQSYNETLSQMRANVVKDYLEGFGFRVNEAVGKGTALGESTNRVVIVAAVND